jgi:hypothetical protein
VRDFPAHHQHQAEPEEEEEQGGDPVLEADHLVIGRKNVFAHETLVFVMRVVGFRMRGMSGWLHVTSCLVLNWPIPNGR